MDIMNKVLVVAVCALIACAACVVVIIGIEVTRELTGKCEQATIIKGEKK